MCREKNKNMAKKILPKQESINLAKLAMIRTELLLEQCNSWLSEEEGRKNMEIMVLERKIKMRFGQVWYAMVKTAFFIFSPPKSEL